MKKEQCSIFFLFVVVFTLIILLMDGRSFASCKLPSGIIIEYRLFGGVPGDMHINQNLMMTNKGVCCYKTLEDECEFIIEKEEIQRIFNLAKKMIDNNPKSGEGFLPDSTISTIRIYDGESKYEVSFYADETLEAAYPALKRPEQFKKLEQIFKETLESHCDKNTCNHSPKSGACTKNSDSKKRAVKQKDGE